MEGDEYAGLVEDVRLNGLREPIWVDQHGRVVDGRNRKRACLEAGVPCTRRTFEGDDDAILRFVISRNLRRRHLDASQRAAIAAELANIKPGNFAGNQHVPSANLQSPLLSQAGAAKLMNVSPRSVADAVKVRNEGAPELFRAVKEGKLTVSRAAKTAKASKGQSQVLTDGNGETRRKIVDNKAKRKPLPAGQPSGAQATAHEVTAHIRRQSRQIVDGVRYIGEELVQARAKLSGSFPQWLQAGLGWSDEDARRFIEVRDCFDNDDADELGVIDLSVLHIAACLAGDQPEEVAEATEPGTVGAE
jgi:hypothetical protein